MTHRILLTNRQRRQKIIFDIFVVVALATVLIGLYNYSITH